MQLVFTIHVIITLLMLKPSTSKTCDNAHADTKETRYGRHHFLACPQTNMYFKELQTAERCCEADDPSYANQPTNCSTVRGSSTRFFLWRSCPIGYYLNGFTAFGGRMEMELEQCCRPQHHPKNYGPCYDGEVTGKYRQTRCQKAGYYITDFKAFCFLSLCSGKVRCCKMAKTELCPRAWIYLEGFCYKFSSQSLTWNAAKTACKNMESTLAVVDSEEKKFAIAAKLPKALNYWIGLYKDPEDTSRWLWIDSSRLCEGCGYWGSGQPDNYKGNEGCGEMRYWDSGRWNDRNCSVKLRYICQKRVLEVTTTQQNITLDEGSTITLHCEVTLTEADDVRTYWLFNGRLRNTTHLQKARGSKTLSNTVKEYNMSLELKHVTLAQSGTYTCGANVTTIIRAQNISLSVHDVLRLEQSESTVQITNGKNRTITCIAVYSEASNVDTFWLFNGSRKQTNSKYEVSDARFKRTEGTMKSRNISLTIYNAGLNDSGHYSCVLNTSHGLRLKNFSVQVVPDGIDNVAVNKSTTGTTNSRLQTSSPTRIQKVSVLAISDANGNESVSKSTTGTTSSHLQTSSPTRLPKVSVLVKSDANGNESTTGITSSHLHTSTTTRSLATQYVSTPSPSSNGLTDMDRHKPTLFTVLGLLGGLIIIIIPMTVVIKFWYRRKYKPPASVRPPPDIDENDFKYDVFVTYSRKDFSWVNRELLRLLRENQVKYCVDHKHFELGKAIVDNITDSVYQSRKVLAVWSGSYASSKYCKQELDYAIQRSFQNSDCSVIVITLDKTDRKQLPKPLRAKTFLDYSDSVERQGWEKRLIKHLKAPNYKKNSKTTIV